MSKWMYLTGAFVAGAALAMWGDGLIRKAVETFRDNLDEEHRKEKGKHDKYNGFFEL